MPALVSSRIECSMRRQKRRFSFMSYFIVQVDPSIDLDGSAIESIHSATCSAAALSPVPVSIGNVVRANVRAGAQAKIGRSFAPIFAIEIARGFGLSEVFVFHGYFASKRILGVTRHFKVSATLRLLLLLLGKKAPVEIDGLYALEVVPVEIERRFFECYPAGDIIGAPLDAFLPDFHSTCDQWLKSVDKRLFVKIRSEVPASIEISAQRLLGRR